MSFLVPIFLYSIRLNLWIPLEKPLGSTAEPRLKNTALEHDVTVKVKCLIHCALVNDAPRIGASYNITQRTEH